jgi:hypothetical protein
VTVNGFSLMKNASIAPTIMSGRIYRKMGAGASLEE